MLGIVAVLLAAVVLAAALASVTFATRGTPFRRVRALDDRVGGGLVRTPGGNTEQPSTWYAARAHYDELPGAGVASTSTARSRCTRRRS